MATDPYAAPRAHVEDAAIDAPDAEFIPGGQSVAAGNGWTWIADGFALFRQQPGMWIALFIIFMVVVGAVSAIPIAGSVATFLFGPVMSAGIVMGCRALDRGGELELAHLFAGFRENTGPLVAVGALYFAGWAAIMVIILLVFGVGAAALFIGAGADMNSPSLGAGAAIGVLLAVLVAMALSIPLVMAVWFASPLVVFHGFTPLEAMKTSFQGCMRNVLPFLLYGVIMMMLAIVATIPLLLGWLALGPVLAASIYTSYRDIYTTS